MQGQLACSQNENVGCLYIGIEENESGQYKSQWILC